MQYLPH